MSSRRSRIGVSRLTEPGPPTLVAAPCGCASRIVISMRSLSRALDRDLAATSRTATATVRYDRYSERRRKTALDGRAACHTYMVTAPIR